MDYFKELFKGHGACHIRFCAENKKITYIKEPATDNLYSSHLEGTYSLGVGTITQDGYCYFGCIDYDTHNTSNDADFIQIENKIKQFGYPLVLCRSKGGGAHLYLFLKDREKASKVKKVLEKWALTIFPKTSAKWPVDIFPAQSRLIQKEDGSYINPKCLNLPYFNHVDTMRYGIENGKKLSLKEFLDTAKRKRVYLDDFLDSETNFLEGAPPCLTQLVKKGIDNHRNIALFNFCVFFKKSDPDNWREQARQINYKYFNPPLEEIELNRTIDSARKREYLYKCQEEPCKSVCNAKVCVKQAHGIQESDMHELSILSVPEIESIKKYETEPPKYELLIENKKISVTMDILYEWRKLRVLISESINRILPSMKNAEWEKILAPLMENVITVKAPLDASPTGIIQAKLIEFIQKGDINTCLDHVSERDIYRGYPIKVRIEGKETVIFKGSSFNKYLKNEKCEIKNISVWIELHKKLGVFDTSYKVGNKEVDFWAVPYRQNWGETYTTTIQEVEF